RRSQFVQRSLLALATAGLLFPTASTAQTSSDSSVGLSATVPVAIADSRGTLADGKYFFGQSPDPNVLGSAYAVLSVRNSQTVGAFYMPHSSFDCFSGQVLPDRLAVDIVDSYDQTVHPYEVALVIDQPLVAGEGAGGYVLEGFHAISEVTEQELNILAVCEADFAQ
ncbi:MAG: hypothetical protein AAFY72_10585, partial [Cyanobacteria bacterium J06649_4]